MAADDEDLLRRVADGDEAAFARLYDLFAPRVFGLVLRIVGDRHAANDVLQEVFLDVWRRSPSFDPSLGGAAPWILMIARGRAVDLVRRGVRERRRINSTMPPAQAQHPTMHDGDWLSRAVPQLPPELREVVHLAYARGLTREQIAQTLGMPVGTVKTRLRAAVTIMAEALRAENGGAP